MNKNITVTTILAAGLLFSFFDVAFAVAPWSLFGSALPTKQGESPNHWALELTYAGMNSYAGVKFQDPSRTLTFDKIWNLSTDYRIEDGDHCIQRSPRFLIELDTDGDGLAEKGVIAYFASSLYSTVCQNGWVNSGNVMDIGSQDQRFDTSEFEKGSTDHTYFDALYLAGDYPVVDILLIVDGEGDGHPQTILVDNMSVNNFKLDAQGFSKKPADVDPSDWAYDYIEKLYSAGITNGCDNFNYCPNDCVTRAQMAAFLARTFDL